MSIYPHNLRQLLDQAIEQLRTSEFAQYTPRLDAELLLSHCLRCQRVDLYVRDHIHLSDSIVSNFTNLINLRSKGHPVAYLLGYKDFYKSTFKVRPGVLIPRPETETLLELAIAAVQNQTHLKQGVNKINIVDLGCGSGCIGLSMLAELPQHTRLLAVDISADALAITRENAENLGVAGRVELLQCAVEELSQYPEALRFIIQSDIILANPPYISSDDPDVEQGVRLYEPHVALFSDQNGLGHFQRWISCLAPHLKVGARCFFELGPDHPISAQKFVEEQKLGFDFIRLHRDLMGIERFIELQKGSSNG